MEKGNANDSLPVWMQERNYQAFVHNWACFVCRPDGKMLKLFKTKEEYQTWKDGFEYAMQVSLQNVYFNEENIKTAIEWSLR